METRTDQGLSNWHRIIEGCSTRVQKNLTFSIIINYTTYTSCISKILAKNIENEFGELKNFKPNTIQLIILSRLNTQEINDLCDILAGKLKGNAGGFNIVTGYGITASGLTAIYFKNLNTRLASFIDDLIIVNPNHVTTIYSATWDSLHGKKIVRQKALILNFSIELLKYTSVYEKSCLLHADNSKDEIILQLAKQQFGLSIFGLTHSYGQYLSTLTELQFHTRLISLLFRHIFNHNIKEQIEDVMGCTDVGNLIHDRLKTNDLRSLTCTSSFFANEKKSLERKVTEEINQKIANWNK